MSRLTSARPSVAGLSLEQEQERDYLVLWVLVLATATVIARAFFSYFGEPLAWVSTADNDDIMRLVSVRTWLAGQNWFDMHQYRFMPPEGVDLHWSRYVDLAIASLGRLFASVMAAEDAETAALVAWPTLLLVALLFITGATARRVFGATASIFAVLSLLLWPPIGPHNFAPYRIDHHGAQILLTTVMVSSLILPGRHVLRGAIAGVSGALSLAIGLEAIVSVGLVGMILICEALFRFEEGARKFGAFAFTLAVAAVAFFAGQTAPADWFVAQCDELSPPFLALAFVGAGVSGVVVLLGRHLPNLGVRIALTAGVVAASAALLYPLLAPCLDGPYGTLPVDARDIIYSRINEARGLLEAVRHSDAVVVRQVVPALIATLFAAGIVAFRMAHGQAGEAEVRAVSVLLLFALIGLLGSFHQVRMIILAAPAIPLLTGYSVATLTAAARNASRGGGLIAIAAVIAMFGTLFLPMVDSLLRAVRASNANTANTISSMDCRRPAVLASLSTIETGSILSHGNLATAILLLTPHSVLSGPYHRSPEAFMNSVLPFERDDTFLREALAHTRADYLLLCRGQEYAVRGSFAEHLDAGERVDWLEEVPGVDPALLVFRVRLGEE